MKKGGEDTEDAGLSIHLCGWEMPWSEITRADQETLSMPDIKGRRSFRDFLEIKGLQDSKLRLERSL